MTIEQFSKEDFEDYLESSHSPFTSLGLVDGEYTYELPLDNQTSITIRSSVKANGLSAGAGKDSIRCWLALSDNKPLGGKGRVHCQPGWQDRLTANIKQLMLWRGLAGDCKECGKPKGIFKARTEENKGRPFTRCREHNGFMWLDEPVKVNEIYFSGESHKSSMPSEQECKEIIAKALRTTPDDITLKPYRVESEESHNASATKTEATEKSEEVSTRDISSQERNGGDLNPDQERVEKTPNSQQKQAIEAPVDANLRVLAGPGSGKSALIEWRYEFLIGNGIDPNSIVVCTFGKQAANSIGQRIQKRCPTANLEQICTIHALCYRLLAKWYPDSRWFNWRGPKDWQVKSTLEDIVGPIWQEEEKPSAQEVFTWIISTKYRGLTTDDSYQWYVSALGPQRGAWLYEIRSKFDAWLNRNRFLTFADQLFLVEQQLKNDANFRAMVQGKFSHVIVDEMQDTNYQAMRILITISLEPGQNTVYESEIE